MGILPKKLFIIPSCEKILHIWVCALAWHLHWFRWLKITLRGNKTVILPETRSVLRYVENLFTFIIMLKHGVFIDSVGWKKMREDSIVKIFLRLNVCVKKSYAFFGNALAWHLQWRRWVKTTFWSEKAHAVSSKYAWEVYPVNLSVPHRSPRCKMTEDSIPYVLSLTL